MKGTRPLTNEEIKRVRDSFDGMYKIRNAGLFMLGVSIGGRVSELLALKIEDVWQNLQPVTDFQFDRNIVKGGEVSRTIPVNVDGRAAIESLIAWHKKDFGSTHPKTPLFRGSKSVEKGKVVAIKRQAVHKILKNAFVKAGLNGKLATHTLRKTFAQRLYHKCNDIFVVKEMLGHKNVATTQAYIGINYVEVREAVEAMSLAAAENPPDPLEAFEPAELMKRLTDLGYMVTKREDIGSSTHSISEQEVILLKEGI